MYKMFLILILSLFALFVVIMGVEGDVCEKVNFPDWCPPYIILDNDNCLTAYREPISNGGSKIKVYCTANGVQPCSSWVWPQPGLLRILGQWWDFNTRAYGTPSLAQNYGIVAIAYNNYCFVVISVGWIWWCPASPFAHQPARWIYRFPYTCILNLSGSDVEAHTHWDPAMASDGKHFYVAVIQESKYGQDWYSDDLPLYWVVLYRSINELPYRWEKVGKISFTWGDNILFDSYIFGAACPGKDETCIIKLSVDQNGVMYALLVRKFTYTGDFEGWQNHEMVFAQIWKRSEDILRFGECMFWDNSIIEHIPNTLPCGWYGFTGVPIP